VPPRTGLLMWFLRGLFDNRPVLGTSIAEIHGTLTQILERLDQMAVSEATFDSDLDALVAAITSYITAAQAAIAAAAAAGYTTEDAQVQASSAQLATALAALSPVAAPSTPAATAALKAS